MSWKYYYEHYIVKSKRALKSVDGAVWLNLLRSILLQPSGCLWHGITVIGKLQILSTFKPINKVLLTKLSNQRYKQTFALLYRIQCSSFRKNSMGKLFLLQCYQVNCWKLSNYGGFIFNVYQLKLVSFQTCHPSQYLKTNINNRIINKFYNRFFGNKDK